MAMLTNYENAFIDLNKLTDYALNEFHPFGKQKAAVFKSVLGIGVNEAEVLKKAILAGLAENESVVKDVDKYGKRFSVINDYHYIW